jgi:hypothetical protein
MVYVDYSNGQQPIPRRIVLTRETFSNNFKFSEFSHAPTYGMRTYTFTSQQEAIDKIKAVVPIGTELVIADAKESKLYSMYRGSNEMTVYESGNSTTQKINF